MYIIREMVKTPCVDPESYFKVSSLKKAVPVLHLP
jgi:hypothetical protein